MMRSGVVLKFSGRKEFRPASRIVGAKDLKIGLDLLIGLFYLSVSLWVVGGREFNVIFEELGEFSG